MNIKDTIASGGKKFNKEKKKAKQINKSRLIVRNLSFKASEDDIRKTFSQFGEIVDVNLPKKENGKIKGFAFLSFNNVGSSLKAIKHMKGKKILNRPVAVDFSLPKKTFGEMQTKQLMEKNEKTTETNNLVDPEDIDFNDEEQDEIEDHETDDDQDEEDFKESRKKSNDVLQQKTVFIRNLDMDTTEESLSGLLSTFGPLEYCKICIDHFTEKSKSTAFAKFKNKDDAQKCLDACAIPDNPQMYIDGQQINISLALPRNKLNELEDSKWNRHKDKRNLYLAREGLIYPNSPAAAGVSQADLKKRLQLEEKKRKLLQNYHNFISDRRMCIHNLPANFDDKKLRQLFLKAANNKNAKILWAKVMCNRSKTDNKFGKSKGFGFIEFNEHVHALNALRLLNNNPEIFTADKRPIVEFTIENMVALNRKKFRQLKQQKLKETDHVNKQTSMSVHIVNSDHATEQVNYSGVMSKPIEGEAKVVQPKLNRKIGQGKNQLKQRKKELKAERKRRQNSERHKQKINMKEAEKANRNGNTKRRDAPEEEVFDDHIKKRRHAFLSSEASEKVVVKKKKWFSS